MGRKRYGISGRELNSKQDHCILAMEEGVGVTPN